MFLFFRKLFKKNSTFKKSPASSVDFGEKTTDQMDSEIIQIHSQLEQIIEDGIKLAADYRAGKMQFPPTQNPTTEMKSEWNKEALRYTRDIVNDEKFKPLQQQLLNLLIKHMGQHSMNDNLKELKKYQNNFDKCDTTERSKAWKLMQNVVSVIEAAKEDEHSVTTLHKL